MSRRVLLESLFFAASLVLALAWTAAPAGAESPLRLTGRAQVTQDGQTQRLFLSADSADGWRLRVTLEPVAGGVARGADDDRRSSDDPRRSDSRGSDDRERVGERVGDDDRLPSVSLAGTFTLDGPGGETLAGQSTGILDRNGGSLRLAGGGETDALTASFTLGGGGELALELTGPLRPAAAPATPDAAFAAAAASNDPTFWFVARASGFTAYLLLFAEVTLGLAVKMRFLDDVVARWRSLDLHKFTAFLGLGFLGLHIAALLADRLMRFSVVELLVPLASSYRPLPVTAGTLAFYAMLLLVASFYVRARIGYRAWRALHYASFGAFVLVLAHGVFAGTDASQVWAQAVYWGTGSIVGLLLVQRFLGGKQQRVPTR